MRINTLPKKSNITTRTHEGAPAMVDEPHKELRRAVLSCMLWENQFYEGGTAIADRIEQLAIQVEPQFLADLAVEARTQYHLRHVPLLLLTVLAKTGAGGKVNIAGTVERTIQRADELGELLAIYWRKGKRPIAAGLKRGLARALRKFNAYALGKYDRDKAVVKLRDVLFMTHAKPKDDEQAAVWKQLVDKTLESPDTWEVALSAGANKRETFTRLLTEGKLGYLALLRNLRNMEQAGVNPKLVANAILARKNGAEHVLPFRFVAAARAAPHFEPMLDSALLTSIEALPRLPGRTIVLVDVSGSMDIPRLSDKSDMTRMDAAAALAALVNCESLRVFAFSNDCIEVPTRRGMGGIDAIRHSQPHGGTYLGKAVTLMNQLPHDRLIVITDEQSHDVIPDPVARHAYMLNVASYKPSVAYGPWTRIDGFSENVIRYITMSEEM